MNTAEKLARKLEALGFWAEASAVRRGQETEKLAWIRRTWDLS